MLNFNSLMIGASDPKRLGEFYKKVFDVEPMWSGDDWYGFEVGSGTIAIGPHSEVSGMNQQPGRLIFNFECDDIEKEFERIKNLNVKIVKDLYDAGDETGTMKIATFEDEEGNYFQITLWKDANE